MPMAGSPPAQQNPSPARRTAPRTIGTRARRWLSKLAPGSMLLAGWPGLDDVVARAKDNAPMVVQASGSVATAQAVGIGARVTSLGNPYLEVVADRGKLTHGIQAIGQLFLPLDINGQRSARIGEADQLLAWRQLARADSQANAMAEAVQAYGEALVSSANLANATTQEAEARSEARWFEAKAAAHDATVVDMSVARAEVSRYVQARAEAQLRLNEARLRLLALTALELDAAPPATLQPEPPALRMTPAASARQVAQGETPILRAMQAEASYWGAFRDRASAEKNQPFFLILHGGRGEFAEARYGAGIAYTFPVARRNQGEVARADAERGRTMQMRATIQRVASARLQGAYTAYSTSVEAVKEMDATGVPAAEAALRATVDSFKEGKVELVRVIIARRDLAMVRARRLELMAAAWRAYAELVAVLGALP